MDKKISVIIPSYNHEKFIGQAVESVLNQTYKNIELIIIDDGSKDSSWDYISGIADKRVISLKQENQGAHNAINTGLKMATGDFLAVLNSDDIFHLNRFETLMNEFNKREELDFLCTFIQLIDADSKNIGVKEGWYNCEPWVLPNHELSYKKKDNFYTSILMSNFVATTSNMIFKRKIFEDIGGMRNLRFAHDWDFMLRLAPKYNCDIIKEPLMMYRLHGNNTINTNYKWMIFEICFVMATHIDKFFGKYIYTNFEENDIIEQNSLLFNSTNFQGNDKIFWLIKSYIDAYKKNGIQNPDELLLDNKTIREQIVEMVVDNRIVDLEPEQGTIKSTIKERIKKIF